MTLSNDGANIPGEEGEVDDPANVQVNNVVHSARLQKTEFTKKQYMIYIKGYMKRVLDHLKANKPERAAVFQSAAANYIKGVLAKFEDYEFYSGESCDFEAAIVLAIYRGEALTPTFIFFKDGLVEEKY